MLAKITAQIIADNAYPESANKKDDYRRADVYKKFIQWEGR